MESSSVCESKINEAVKKISILFILIFIFSVMNVSAQYKYGTTGLLQMPTADMQKDKTLMIGVSALNPKIIPSQEWWGNYHTLNYYLNITIFPWLEVGYNCVLVKGKEGIYHWPESTWGKFVNQDRSFHGRLRIWKEGWWKEWTPQIVLGINDPTSGGWEGGGSSDKYKHNGFFQRYYIAITKHFIFNGIGNLGIHTAYVYNKRDDYPLNGPCIGANLKFNFPTNNMWIKAINGLNIMAEYDSRTINIGASYSIWKDHINLVTELTECKHISGGILFKVHLK
ncbi:MAG: YjbH domain-containing protein [Bacteroides sp]|nr:YjbH domain-containing protein [Bacteroides sp.]